ncbi:MAG: adenylate/guanylate cyclase domain-containing protein [Bacteroidota bacterium]|nr:adenylate/guanylate cyclase domain-containing protein [Bacteroidota bacterium]
MEKQTNKSPASKVSILEERIDYLEKLNQELVEQNDKLREENDKTSELLSFLPTDAKNQIKMKGKASSLRYKMVTVLFADVKGFTKLSETENAEELIDELDDFFFFFDEVVKKNNIQKVKSIGDTYMCAGGIPKKNRTNPIEVIKAALEVQDYLQSIQEKSEKSNRKIWNLTFGIHTGPVTADVSGKRKISYSIKGDTVNIASRIESASNPTEISISEMTYAFMKDFFVCEYRSKIPIKYKGDTPVYTVKGLRPELSSDDAGRIPNDTFNTKFQMIQFEDINDYIMDRLERELPKHLYYHNLKHTIDVTIGVEILGSGEGVDDKEMILLKTAALFHDFGQIKGALNHEKRSCEIAKDILPKFDYSPEQIETIVDIIMATKLPPTPKTKLQRIICDADLDYLGRKDFIPVSDTLYRELKVQGLITDFNEWNKMQLKFLSSHQFFTKTAQNMRLVNKEKQINRIKKIIVEED